MMIPDIDQYFTIAKPSSAEFKDRGSRFLAFTYPIARVEEFKNYLAALKKEHPKAAHHCFAYRLGFDGTIFRVSDDGEPSGSAGRPILGQIDSKQLTDVLVVVVRYFGGSLLGVPGLINAYKAATREALELSGIIKKPIRVNYNLEFAHMQLNDVMRIVKQFDCTVVGQELQLFCSMLIAVPKNRKNEVETRLKDIKGLTQSGG